MTTSFDFTANLKDRDRIKRLADFLFEIGMLRHTPRTGYHFLGSGKESVAEHSFRTAVTGYVLADMAGADKAKTVLLCLFHDMHEARTGDFNYVHRKYNSCDRTQALRDATMGTGLAEGILALWGELEDIQSIEAELAQDADQIDLILSLKEELDLGNKYAGQWMEGALKRLRTEYGKQLAAEVSTTDHTDWWYKGPDPTWWENKNGRKK